MKYPRYHVSALCNSIEEQIEDVDWEETHKVRTHIETIRALLRIGEPELHELGREDEPDEDVEEEEPIYFTTWEDVAEQCGTQGKTDRQLAIDSRQPTYRLCIAPTFPEEQPGPKAETRNATSDQSRL